MKRSDSPKPRRVRAAEAVYKQNGVYVAGFRDPESGKWTMPTLKGARTLTEAKRMRRKMITDREARRTASRSTLTLGTLAQEWLASRASLVRPRTLEKDTASVALIERFFGTARVQDIDGRRVEAFIVALRAGKVGLSKRPLSEWTCVAVIKTLRQILDRAVITDVLTINPVSRCTAAHAAETEEPNAAAGARCRAARRVGRRRPEADTRLRRDHRQSQPSVALVSAKFSGCVGEISTQRRS